MTNMKTIKRNKQKTFLIYLFFWLGLLLTVAGLTAGVITSKWSGVPLGLLIAGIAIIGLWLILSGIFAPSFWGRRSTQAGTNAVIATIAMLAILGLVNFLGVRYDKRWDLTENQLFTLSPLSQEVVKNLEQPIKVWVFDPKPDAADRELLENYRRYGSNLKFEFVDPQLKPVLAQKYNVRGPGEVYLEYGSQRQLVQTVNEQEGLSEVRLTNAIERLTSDRADTVYFLEGHGERPLEQVEDGISQAVDALTEKNFTVQPLNLVDRAEVPDDASLVALVGPQRALFPQEVQALRNYLSTGGSVLLMLDPQSSPGLDNLLADWGVKPSRQIAIDASGQGQIVGLGPATPLVKSYGNHPITNDFGNGFSFYPLAQPLVTTPIKGVEQAALVTTNPQSWAENTPEKQPLEFNENEGDRPGPLTLGVALSRRVQSPSTLPTPSPNETPQASPTPEAGATETPEASPTASPNQTPQASPSPNNGENANKKAPEARLVVFGTSNFASDGWFGQQLNGDVFLNSVSWLSKRDEQAFSIRPREQKNRRINLTPLQAIALGWTALAIVPLVGLTTAGVMWWRRR